jgi:hypothetical protein
MMAGIEQLRKLLKTIDILREESSMFTWDEIHDVIDVRHDEWMTIDEVIYALETVASNRLTESEKNLCRKVKEPVGH